MYSHKHLTLQSSPQDFRRLLSRNRAVRLLAFQHSMFRLGGPAPSPLTCLHPLLLRTPQEFGRCMEALGIKLDLIRWTNSFMSDCQIRLALNWDMSPSGYSDTARIASGSNTVHYLPVWNLRQGGPGDPGAVICGRHDWVVGGGCKQQPTTNRQWRFQLRLLSLQWGGGAGRSKRGDETKQFRNSWFTSILWFPVRNQRKRLHRSCCTRFLCRET